MAKSHRVAKSRTSARKPARVAKKKAQAPRRGPVRSAAGRPAARKAVKAVRTAKPAPKALAKVQAKPQPKAAPAPPPPPPQPPPRKPTYHEAVAMYERGLQALQRRDFAASADALRIVIERYPDERELLERARLYLKVCERELEPKEPAPKTADEWVYAATVAQNSGDDATALRHLQRALAEDARHDHAHYMMAVASAQRQDTASALDHLRRAVSLNPENRSRARQDPDLEALRDDTGFRTALDAPPAEGAAPKPVAVPIRPRAIKRR
jgi:hypothetical protein